MKTIDNRDVVEMDDNKLIEELEQAEKEENETKDEEIEEIEEVVEEESEEEEEKEEVVVKKEVKEEKPKVDYETKFKESTKEAMIMKAKLDEIEAEKNKPVEINDEYMKANYPDWEDMTVTEQRLARRTEEQDQKIKELTNKTNEYNNDKKWRDQIDSLVDDVEFTETYPKMKGKTEEFKKFCSKPTRKGVDMDILASAFLFEVKDTPKELKTLFKETKGSSAKTAPKAKLTTDEQKALRKGSNSKFMDLLKDPKYDPLADL